MRTILIFVFFSVLFSFSDSSDCKTEAEIYGYDYTRCGCCGGWIVYIDGKKYLSETDIPNWEKPPELAFTKFILISGEPVECPINVRINYTPTKRCEKIDIQCIERIN